MPHKRKAIGRSTSHAWKQKTSAIDEQGEAIMETTRVGIARVC